MAREPENNPFKDNYLPDYAQKNWVPTPRQKEPDTTWNPEAPPTTEEDPPPKKD